MQRLTYGFSAALLAVAIWLGVDVWRERENVARSRQDLSARQKVIVTLQAKVAAARSKSKMTNAAENSAPAPDPKALEIKRELDALNTQLQTQRFRRNALNGYVAGFERLNLSPETLARAKEIILAGWKTSTERQKQVRSVDDLEQMKKAEQAELIALLGQDGFETLDAATREESLDWEIGTDMWDGGAPLAPEQLRALALTETRLNIQRTPYFLTPKPEQIPDAQTWLSSQDAALLSASAEFLSPAQEEILRRSLIEENQYTAAMRGFGEKQRQLYSGAGGSVH